MKQKLIIVAAAVHAACTAFSADNYTNTNQTTLRSTDNGGVHTPHVIVDSPTNPTGAATAANQSTANATLGSIDAKTPALVGGRQPVDGSGVTQPVSGTVAVTPAAMYSADVVLQNAATAIGNGSAMDVSGLGGIAVQVTGVTTATIIWEVTIDGTNWTGIFHANTATGGFNTVATNASANGIYSFRLNGAKQFRARISSYSSGTITITAHGTVDGNSGPVLAALSGTGGAMVGSAAGTDGLTSTSTGLMVNAYSALRTGTATTDQARTPAVVKDLGVLAIGTIATVWTPASGKKFRLMGGTFSVDAAVSVLFEDNAAGAGNFVFRTPVLQPGVPYSLPPNFGNGRLSAAANNVLKATSSGAANITGTLFGTEE